jgi:hypothetical protein
MLPLKERSSYPAHYSLSISNRHVRIGSVRSALSTGIAFLLGVFHRSRHKFDAGRLAKVLSAASFHNPSQGVICVSRPLGNFDTTACCTALQVEQAGKSYPKGISSGTTPVPGFPPDAQNATPHEVAFCFPVLVTGLPANSRRWCVPPRLWQTFPAGLPFFRAAHWRMLLPGVCWFVGWPDFSSSRYITGTL